MAFMEITLYIPADVEDALRARAEEEHKSLDCVALDAVKKGLGVPMPQQHRDLSDLAGRRTMDAATLAALQEQRQVDPDLWK
jgi:hypothetical protein